MVRLIGASEVRVPEMIFQAMFEGIVESWSRETVETVEVHWWSGPTSLKRGVNEMGIPTLLPRKLSG